MDDPDGIEEVANMLHPMGLGTLVPRDPPQMEQGLKRGRKQSSFGGTESQVVKRKKSGFCRYSSNSWTFPL